MGNPDTLVLNLTFFGTVGMAFLMFLILFLLGVITLVLAGVGRLAAVTLMALFRRRFRSGAGPLIRTGRLRPSGYNSKAVSACSDATGASAIELREPGRQRRDWRVMLKPAHLRAVACTVVARSTLPAARREPPALARDWASAVAEADARADARTRAAAPDIKLTVRDLPDPRMPADKVVTVSPLVESALENHRPGQAPRSFTKTQAPRPLPPLDTGSLVSLSGPAQAVKAGLSSRPTAQGTAAGRPTPPGPRT